MATIAGWLPRLDAHGKWLVRSEVRQLRQHFVPELGKSARCADPNYCPLCAHGYKVQVCWALPLSLDGSNTIRLLRLLEKDKHAVEWCIRQGTKLVGTLVDLSVVGYIDIAPIQRRVIPEVPIDNYFAAIGRKAFLTAIDSLRERTAAGGAEELDVDVDPEVPAAREARKSS